MSESTVATRAWIGLGANLGAAGSRPAETLERALRWLDITPGLRVQARSSIHHTPPLGPVQPDFVNAVARVSTTLAPRELLAVLTAMEGAAGRRRGERWGPRTLDLDLLLYGPRGERVLEDPECTLPHPGMAERRFVLAPLCELDPDLVHPRLDRSARHLLEALPCDDFSEQ